MDELREGLDLAGQHDGTHQLLQKDLEGEDLIVRHWSDLGPVRLDCWTMCWLVYSYKVLRYYPKYRYRQSSWFYR